MRINLATKFVPTSLLQVCCRFVTKVFNHITSCEHFQHIKSILELYPDEERNPTPTCILSEFIFTNSKIIDRSDHWSLLLFKESLAIRRLKPELNHGTKASKELIIFN